MQLRDYLELDQNENHRGKGCVIAGALLLVVLGQTIEVDGLKPIAWRERVLKSSG